MKARELAEILLRHPDLEVTIQHQNYLQPINNCMLYMASRLYNDELWVKAPPPSVQAKMQQMEVEPAKPEEVWALSQFVDRQFLGITKEQAKDIGRSKL